MRVKHGCSAFGGHGLLRYHSREESLLEPFGLYGIQVQNVQAQHAQGGPRAEFYWLSNFRWYQRSVFQVFSCVADTRTVTKKKITRARLLELIKNVTEFLIDTEA